MARLGSQNLPLAAVALFCLAGIVWGHEGVHYDIEFVTAELAKSPDRVDLYVRRGHLYRLDKHLEASLADLDRAVSLEPDNHDALLQRGITLAAMGRDTEAESLFDRVARERPDEARVWLARGHLRARTGREELAIADYTKAIELSHDVP